MSSQPNLIQLSKAGDLVPEEMGLYAIFVNDPQHLPGAISDYLDRKWRNVIYVGKAAKQTLLQRLVKQDLRGTGNATFFRGLGAVLGFTPRPGSLIGKSNQNNYRFSLGDRNSIVEWIDGHLHVSWVTMMSKEASAYEPILVKALTPPFNKDHNPVAVVEIAKLRYQCRLIARGTPL